MKMFKQLILGSVMMVGLSLTAFAQKDEPKKPPPKERPPKVEPAPAKPPPRNPKDDDKPKKPGMEFGVLFIARNDHRA